MTFNDITTPFEKRAMLLYGSDGHKIVRHNVMVRHISGNLYMGEVQKREGCSYSSCALYFYLSEYGIGLLFGTIPSDDETVRAEREANAYGMASPEAFIAYLDRCVESAKYIPTNMIALAEYICPEKIPRYRESNEWILKLRAEKDKAERAERERKDAEYVANGNKNAEAKVLAAIEILRTGGTLKNDDVQFYRTRYDYSIYCMVNHLMRKYGVPVPLRTQGWINSKLKTVTVRDHHCTYVQYMGTRKSKAVDTFFGYMELLLKAVAEENAA